MGGVHLPLRVGAQVRLEAKGVDHRQVGLDRVQRGARARALAGDVATPAREHLVRFRVRVRVRVRDRDRVRVRVRMGVRVRVRARVRGRG